MLYDVIDGMVQTSMNVDVHVAEGEVILGEGNVLVGGFIVGPKENNTNSEFSTRFRIPCGIFM